MTFKEYSTDREKKDKFMVGKTDKHYIKWSDR